MHPRSMFVLLGVALLAVGRLAAEEKLEPISAETPASNEQLEDNPNARPLAAPVWRESYYLAMEQAKAEKKLMLIHFYRPADQQRKEAGAAVDSVANIEQALQEPGLREKLDAYVLTKLPVEAKISVQGKPLRLVGHEAYSELRNGPGLAVVDFAHTDTAYYGFVVSVLPFTPGKYYRFHPNHLQALVDLPRGSLTQRSMVLAVRIHPERPASTTGEDDPILLSEASSQSQYQAKIRVQGHHNWESRFHRIIGRLLGRGTPGAPVEVVAESWPNQDLMDSCVDCVASWRQSDGHWNAVKARQASYGYDIKRADNGIWYATGIFRPR